MLLLFVTPVEVAVDLLGRSPVGNLPGLTLVETSLVPVREEACDVSAGFRPVRGIRRALASQHGMVPCWSHARLHEPDFHLVVVLDHAGDQAGQRARPVIRHGHDVGGLPSSLFGELDEGVGLVPSMETRTSRAHL